MCKLASVLSFGLTMTLLSACQSHQPLEVRDVGSYDYCMQSYRALETAYRHDLARGLYQRHQSLVQPRNISEKCMVSMWSQGTPGTYDLSWSGACSDGYAVGLGMVTLYNSAGQVNSMRLYEGLGNGKMVAYFGLSDLSGKIWYGIDDGLHGRFYVADLDREDGEEYALSAIDYDQAQTLEFIFSDEGSAAVRLHPNYSEIYSRSYTEGNYISDLLYALYAITPDGHSTMSGVGFLYSGHDDTITALDVSLKEETQDPKRELNTRYLIERLDGEKTLLNERRELSELLHQDLKLSRLKLTTYKRMVCSSKRNKQLHLSSHEDQRICSFKTHIPSTLEK